MHKPQIKTLAQAAMDAFESRPKNSGPMRDASAHAKITGPCGDTVEVWLRMDGGTIRKGSFMSDGCGYSRHCCSTAVRLAEGMLPEEAAEMTQQQVLAAAGEIPPDHQHCALLAVHAIQEAIRQYQARPEKMSLGQKLWRVIHR